MYTIQIPVFEGPFDLLLQLIEREKLDISAVSLASVTDQFVAHIAALEGAIVSTWYFTQALPGVALVSRGLSDTPSQFPSSSVHSTAT